MQADDSELPDSTVGVGPPSLYDVPADSTGHAYQQVRAAILDGTLAPGSVFSQVQLAAQLGVSRTPLREALRLLQNEGLVKASYNRRVEVAALSLDDMEGLYALRIVAESLGVRLTVPRLTPASLAELAVALDRMHAAATRRDIDAIRESHWQFHLRLFGLAGERLVRQISDIWDHAERYRRLYQGSADASLDLMVLARQEHVRMVELATAGDAVATSRLIAQHLARTAVTVMARVDGVHDAAMVREALRMVIEAS